MIYVECYSDEALVKALEVPNKEIIHAGNKGNVCNFLKKKQKVKGLVDDDPESAQPTYIKRLVKRGNDQGIKILIDTASNNLVIVLCPSLEGWIIEVAKENKIKLFENYGLSDDPDELHKIINSNLRKFQTLISDLKEKYRSSRLTKLERLLKERL